MLRNLHRLLINTPPIWRCTHRCATNAAAQNKIKYTDTINLPKTKFPPRLTAAKRAEVERHINKSCFADLYQWQRHNLRDSADEFVLHDGPPYANGDLHMGHAINKILKDIVLRQNVINGRRVHYRPGWDCHGLPIELKALGSSETNRQPLDIRAKARTFAAETIEKQRTAFAAWGVMADWSVPEHSYRTMDAAYIRNQLRVFQRMYADGCVYRDMKPVYWSPSARTALAEAELEYDTKYVSPSLTLRLRFARVPQPLQSLVTNAQLYALIWTTTPWSLPANQAVCVNENLQYSAVRLSGHNANDAYVIASDLIDSAGIEVDEVLAQFNGRDLLDGEYYHPIDRSETMPILAATHVQATKGTGLVHTAPAHGPDDFLVSLQQQNMPLKCLVDADGVYNADAPDFLRGHEVLESGNRLVLDHVRDDIVTLSTLEHSYPIDWRTKKPVLIRASEQWFINTARIKDAAIAEIDQVAVYPQKAAAVNKANLVAQLRRRPYWCISRQRAWGTPIPVFYNRQTGAEIVDARIVDRLCELLRRPEANGDLWWSLPVEELIPAEVLAELGLNAADVRKGEDILDIWFDSGISWSFALEADADGKHVADLYLEGHDQFTGWFQSSLMTSVAAQQCAPYRSLFVHGFAVDETGAKMSKSIGNYIVPADIIEQYGVDTLRWWVAHHATQHTSIPVGGQTLQSAAECVQKCRATLKYLVGCVGGMEASETSAPDAARLKVVDKHFLNALAVFEADIQALYASHQYNRAAASIVNFVTNEMSAAYLHLIKDRLYCGTADEHRSLQSVLYVAYVTLNRALWPITPFMVEECWSYFDAEPFYARAAVSKTNPQPDNAHVELIALVQQLKQQLNQSVRDTNTWTLNVTISGPPDVLEKLGALQTQRLQPQHDSQLCELLQVGSCTLLPDDGCSECTLSTQRIEGALCARCRRFSVIETTAVCNRCTEVLKEKS